MEKGQPLTPFWRKKFLRHRIKFKFNFNLIRRCRKTSTKLECRVERREWRVERGGGNCPPYQGVKQSGHLFRTLLHNNLSRLNGDKMFTLIAFLTNLFCVRVNASSSSVLQDDDRTKPSHPPTPPLSPYSASSLSLQTVCAFVCLIYGI